MNGGSAAIPSENGEPRAVLVPASKALVENFATAVKNGATRLIEDQRRGRTALTALPPRSGRIGAQAYEISSAKKTALPATALRVVTNGSQSPCDWSPTNLVVDESFDCTNPSASSARHS